MDNPFGRSFDSKHCYLRNLLSCRTSPVFLSFLSISSTFCLEVILFWYFSLISHQAKDGDVNENLRVTEIRQLIQVSYLLFYLLVINTWKQRLQVVRIVPSFPCSSRINVSYVVLWERLPLEKKGVSFHHNVLSLVVLGWALSKLTGLGNYQRWHSPTPCADETAVSWRDERIIHGNNILWRFERGSSFKDLQHCSRKFGKCVRSDMPLWVSSPCGGAWSDRVLQCRKPWRCTGGALVYNLEI